MQIGVIGLGRMGLGIARRLETHGFRVVGFDIGADPREAAKMSGLSVADSLESLVDMLSAPRTVWMMLPAGEATEATVGELETLLEPGDLVIDGGNSHYRDSIDRGDRLATRSIAFLDVGTSGGIRGEADGYCLMIGGEVEVVERARTLFEALAPTADSGWGHVGETGAGHFAKMVHNGVEYGLMQAYAEGFAILDAKADLGLDAARVAKVWKDGSIVRSCLLDLTHACLAREDGVEDVRSAVADTGGGRWAVREAIDLDVPAPVITASLLQRIRSRTENGFADRLLAAMRREFGGHAADREGGGAE